jgi:hypothetical protein
MAGSEKYGLQEEERGKERREKELLQVKPSHLFFKTPAGNTPENRS